MKDSGLLLWVIPSGILGLIKDKMQQQIQKFVRGGPTTRETCGTAAIFVLTSFNSGGGRGRGVGLGGLDSLLKCHLCVEVMNPRLPYNLLISPGFL